MRGNNAVDIMHDLIINILYFFLENDLIKKLSSFYFTEICKFELSTTTTTQLLHIS